MEILSGKNTIYDYVAGGLPDGDSTLVLAANNENVNIDVEVYNFLEDVTYTATPTLGDAIADTKMLILIYNGNLTINAGVIITPKVRKKGVVIYVTGSLINNGTIVMTARGAKAAGQNVYLYQNDDNTFECIPAAGAAGGIKDTVTKPSFSPSGSNGANRQTGGGATGGGCYSYGGLGAAGTSYSGGSAGGGRASSGDSLLGNPGGENGGPGGNAMSTNSAFASGGGAGNNGGAKAGNNGHAGDNGTGGLLVIFANDIVNNGVIASNGSNGGNAYQESTTCAASGGGSGGGSINLFYIRTYTNTGSITANGGISGTTHWASSYRGGNGGKGSITAMQITPIILIFSVNIAPTHFYEDAISSVTVSGVIYSNEDAATPLPYSILVNGIEVFEASINPARAIPIDKFSHGNNTIILKEATTRISKSIIVFGEVPHRVESMRTFKNYDGGFLKNNTDFDGEVKVRSKKQVAIVNIENNFVAQLDKFSDKIEVK